MEIRLGSQGFPRLLPHRIHAPLRNALQSNPRAKVLSSLRFPRNSLAKHAVRLCRMLARVLSRLATSPFQSSFRIAPSPPFTSPRRRIVRDIVANDDFRLNVDQLASVCRNFAFATRFENSPGAFMRKLLSDRIFVRVSQIQPCTRQVSTKVAFSVRQIGDRSKWKNEGKINGAHETLSTQRAQWLIKFVKFADDNRRRSYAGTQFSIMVPSLIPLCFPFPHGQDTVFLRERM